jgi:hypothetical protein
MNKTDITSKITALAEKLHQLAMGLEENPATVEELLHCSRELNELIAHYNYLPQTGNVHNVSENITEAPISSDKPEEEKAAEPDQPEAMAPTTPEEQPNKVESDHTINTKFESMETSSWGATLNKKPILNLKTDIGINERFFLIKELFGGSTENFNHSIETLEGCSNRKEAIECFTNKLAEKYGWDDESEALDIFLNLLTRRYSV